MKRSEGAADPGWTEAVPVFPAAARTGCATSAGAVLGLAPATVLRQLTALEEALEVLPTGAVLDLERREADLAPRRVRPEHGDLVARKLSDVPLVFVAAPSLIARVAPTRLADLPRLGWEPSVGAAEDRLLAEIVPGARVVLLSTQMVGPLAAAQVGVGALRCGESLAAREGGLVRVPLASPSLPAAALWLVTHRALHDVPRVAAVWSWPVSSFSHASAAGELWRP
jgi:DNA-binding transcriptional LysR family regulator